MSEDAEQDLKLEIAHILTIDVVAYSTLLIHEQSRLMTELNRAVRNAPRFRTAEAEGTLVRLPTGDGMALVFRGDPEAPIECAMQVSTELKTHPEIRLRMGIHSGPISRITDVNDRSNVAGAGIDMAQRVMDCGDSGHILVSKRVADDLAPYSRWNHHLHDLGECRVKHDKKITVFNFYTGDLGNPATPARIIEETERKQSGRVAVLFSVTLGKIKWALVALAAAVSAGFLWHLSHRAPAIDEANSPTRIPEKSIAILPFENRSAEKANAYFTDGIQDEILTRLSKIADLTVISRTSTQRYKSAPENVPEIGRQLGVAFIVEGSVQRIGDAVRVNVQLIKAATDSHIWADTFDRSVTDIFAVETEVAKAIADQLRVRLTGQEQQAISEKPTSVPAAYDAYLRGLAYTLKAAITPSTTLGAQRAFRDAVSLDPKFSYAWALLSYVDSVGYLSLKLQPTVALRDEARHAAETALQLQPQLGEALLAKGYYHYACLKDYSTAVRYFEEARQFLPNSSRIPESLAYVARRRGEWERSEYHFEAAERLDPRNINLLTQHALSDVERRRFPEAIAKLDKVLDIEPDDLDIVAQKAAIAQAQGDIQGAAALLVHLRPGPEASAALETQAYQAILERQPARMISRLGAILDEPDPALGYINGELRWWLGWLQEVAGDQIAATETWRQSRTELETFLKEQPDNYSLLGDLALVEVCLGNRSAAVELAERAIALITIEQDAIEGGMPIEFLARVAARAGDADRAIGAIEKVLSIPYDGALASGVPLTSALLHLDPMFDSLRGDPRFQKLAGDAARKY